MQLEEARKYCEYMGFEFQQALSRLHSDLDISGFRKAWRSRPGLMEHYRAAERGEFDVLIFYKISRLARNVREALDMIEAFEKLGVSFHFVAERIDSTSGPGRFVRNVLLSAAEMQSEDTSEFLKATCERRAREGKLQGGATPSWINRNDQGAFELIPEQVAAVRRMVELRMSGLGYVRIAQTMNLEGFRSVRGSYWSDGMAYKYLQPTWVATMCGTAYFGRDASEPIEIPNAYPPILSEEEARELLALQKLYSKDYSRKPVNGLDWMVSARRKRGRYSASSIHLLSSLVFCPRCGARMVACMKSEHSHRASPYVYSCPNYRTRSELHQRQLSSISAEGLEDAVLRVIRSVLVMPPAEQSHRVIAKLDGGRRLLDVQNKIDHLVSMHLDGRIEEDDFKRSYADLLSRKNMENDRQDLETTSIHTQKAVAIATDSEPSREDLRQLVVIMVERVEAPLIEEGLTIRLGSSSLRKLAQITLRFPDQNGIKTYLAPVYRATYTYNRECWPVA